MGKYASIDDFRIHLEELVRARTPLFYLGSIEVRRSIEEVKKIVHRIGAEIQIFYLGRGVLEGYGDKTNTDPVNVLDMVLKRGKTFLPEKPRVWVLIFFHLLVQAREALILSKLREIVEFSRFKDTVVLLGVPDFHLPPELADIPVINIPPPGRLEIDALLDSDLDSGEKTRIAQACLGFSVREIEDLFARSLARKGKLNPDIIEELRAEKIRDQGNDLFEIKFPRERLEQVGGLGLLKEWLEMRRRPFLEPEVLKKWNLPPPKGLLLTGVPGCGKSLLCKALAGSWAIPLIQMDSSRILSAPLGASEQNFHRCLDLARLASPCVLWVDEVEKQFAATDSRTDGGASGRILAIFLNFLQERDHSAFVVATSNDLSSIPPEMLRKGRWDEIFFIDLPAPRGSGQKYAIP